MRASEFSLSCVVTHLHARATWLYLFLMLTTLYSPREIVTVTRRFWTTTPIYSDVFSLSRSLSCFICIDRSALNSLARSDTFSLKAFNRLIPLNYLLNFHPLARQTTTFLRNIHSTSPFVSICERGDETKSHCKRSVCARALFLRDEFFKGRVKELNLMKLFTLRRPSSSEFCLVRDSQFLSHLPKVTSKL